MMKKTTSATGTTATPSPPSTQSKQFFSFYRRPLPTENCVALSSIDGQKIFNSSHARGGLKSFFDLIQQFTTQPEPAFCGLTSLVMVLNALAVDPRRNWKGPWRWYDERFLNCCVELDEVEQSGITFATFACLARCQGLSVDGKYGSDSTLEDFRNAVRIACVADEQECSRDDCKFLVVSYSRKAFAQTGDGHFSPIAAYDEESDSVLLLDTARFKYGAHWVKLESMFEALQFVDPSTGRTRGYALLSYEFRDDGANEQHVGMPQSLLFRSKKSQDPVRRCYNEYLSERQKVKCDRYELFQHILDYWNSTKKEEKSIWSMLTPQLVGIQREERDMVDALLALVDEMMNDFLSMDHGVNKGDDGGRLRTSNDGLINVCCSVESGCKSSIDGVNAPSRMISVSSMQAIFLVFLASLSSNERKELISTGKYPHHGGIDVSEQLSSEVNLIAFALDQSK